MEYVSINNIVNDLADKYEDLLADYPCKVELIDFEKRMKEDIKEGNGFIITDKIGLDKQKTTRLENGIYSPKYGSIWGDENAFEELYSCDCGDIKAKMNMGVLCPICNSRVKFRDKNVHMTGWFKLDKYKLIHPNIYYKLASLIGYKRLKAILRVDWETEITGHPIKPIIQEKSKNVKKYDNIGMFEFEKRFDEICEFFLYKKKDKKDVYDFIMENREKVFTSCLPCIPLFLRPIIIGEEDFSYTKINSKYTGLSAKIFNINYKHKTYDDKEEKILLNRLYSIQNNYYYVCDMIMDMLSKKNGHIRNDVLGFRSNFTTRAVITPLSGTKMNEIHFCYLGFLEMYKPEILNTLCKLKDITINEALELWQKAQLKFDKRIYSCMKYIISHTDCYILLNRNPTLNFGSIVRVKITHVKPVYDDLTISIPINILTTMAADFDGDQMNTISLKDLYLKKAYETFDPRMKMIISKNDGLFDNSFNLIKDQLICFHQFNKLGNKGIKVIKPPKDEKDKDSRFEYLENYREKNKIVKIIRR